MVLISLHVHQVKDSGQLRKIQVCEHGVIMQISKGLEEANVLYSSLEKSKERKTANT